MSKGTKGKKILGGILVFLGVMFGGSAVVGMTEILKFLKNGSDKGFGSIIVSFILSIIIAIALIRKGRDMISGSNPTIEHNYDTYTTTDNTADTYSAVEPEKETPPIVGVGETDGMEGHRFEYYCADVLRNNGFTRVEVTKGSGDQGVDILADKDGIKYAIQCKSYSSKLGNTPIQEVSAGRMYYNCHVGVVMTNSTFTPAARELAASTNVLLWDRYALDRMIKAAK